MNSVTEIHLSNICSGNNPILKESIADISDLEMLGFGANMGRLSSPPSYDQLYFYLWYMA